MKSEGYKIRDQYGVYFITFATVQWVDVFTRSCYVDTVLDSLRYCVSNSAGKHNGHNTDFQFWQQDNRPVQLETSGFTMSKLDYTHNNPVKAGLVEKAEDYLWSSARDYNGGKGLLPIEHLTAAYEVQTIR